MDPMTLMALAGLAKAELIDKPEQERQRKLNAEEKRYNWITHLTPTPITQKYDPFGSAFSYGVAGAALGGGGAGSAEYDFNPNIPDTGAAMDAVKPNFGDRSSWSTMEQPQFRLNYGQDVVAPSSPWKLNLKF